MARKKSDKVCQPADTVDIEVKESPKKSPRIADFNVIFQGETYKKGEILPEDFHFHD